MPSKPAHGPTIRAIREANGISLRAMANEISTPPSHLSRIERGQRGASPTLIRAISVRLGVSVDAITSASHGANGLAIRAIREGMGVSLRALAKDVAIRPTRLARIERCEVDAPAALIAAIAERLQVSVEAIVTPELAAAG